MSYIKTDWVDNATPLNAINLNNIEAGISGNEANIIANNEAIITNNEASITASNEAVITSEAFTMSQLPAGEVSFFAMATAPDGWLKANGVTVNRVTYARLFTAIGTLYGVGDGSTTFQLPDLRGQFIRGFDDGAGIDPARVMGSIQADRAKVGLLYDGSIIGGNIQLGNIGNTAHFVSDGTGLLGRTNSPDTETRPKNVALLACIKY